MGKLKHLGMSLLLATTFFSCGDDYDDTALRNDVNDLKSRVEKLESWCSTTNTQISALQGLVSLQILIFRMIPFILTAIPNFTMTVLCFVFMTKTDDYFMERFQPDFQKKLSSCRIHRER